MRCFATLIVASLDAVSHCCVFCRHRAMCNINIFAVIVWNFLVPLIVFTHPSSRSNVWWARFVALFLFHCHSVTTLHRTWHLSNNKAGSRGRSSVRRVLLFPSSSSWFFYLCRSRQKVSCRDSHSTSLSCCCRDCIWINLSQLDTTLGTLLTKMTAECNIILNSNHSDFLLFATQRHSTNRLLPENTIDDSIHVKGKTEARNIT